MKGIKIRSARIKDWKQLHAIDSENFDTNQLQTEEVFGRLIQSKNRIYIVGEKGGKIFGTLMLTIDGTKGVINRVSVKKSNHRQGIGMKLMTEIISIAERKQLTQLKLYALQTNPAALGLYQKTEFQVAGESWHYIIPVNQIKAPLTKYKCELLNSNEINTVVEKYQLNKEIVSRFHTESENLTLVLKKKDELIGYCRFTPSFPGAFPFIIDDLEGFDSFASHLKSLRDPQFDHVRITFENDKKLADLCKKRGYTLHHEMYHMVRKV